MERKVPEGSVGPNGQRRRKPRLFSAGSRPRASVLSRPPLSNDCLGTLRSPGSARGCQKRGFDTPLLLEQGRALVHLRVYGAEMGKTCGATGAARRKATVKSTFVAPQAPLSANITQTAIISCLAGMLVSSAVWWRVPIAPVSRLIRVTWSNGIAHRTTHAREKI
eukprot:gene22353-biopygen7198